jgi:hypothetical protein
MRVQALGPGVGYAGPSESSGHLPASISRLQHTVTGHMLDSGPKHSEVPSYAIGPCVECLT